MRVSGAVLRYVCVSLVCVSMSLDELRSMIRAEYVIDARLAGQEARLIKEILGSTETYRAAGTPRQTVPMKTMTLLFKKQRDVDEASVLRLEMLVWGQMLVIVPRCDDMMMRSDTQ